MENWGYHRKAPDGTSVGEVFTTMNQWSFHDFPADLPFISWEMNYLKQYRT
jgi:hypothetical protein